MQGQDHSYLDLSVLAELRSSILSTDAVVLLNSNLKKIIWANANGAKLFGGQGISDLLLAKLSDEQSIIKQLKNSVKQLESGSKAITRSFRIGLGAKSILLQFEIKRISLPDKDFGFKVTNFSEDESLPDESVTAKAAVKSLNNFADAAAILDDYGIPISASSEFGDLAPDEETLTNLAKELQDEDDRLIKRPVESYSGETVAAGLARISDKPGRILIVLARTNIVSTEETRPLAKQSDDVEPRENIDEVQEDEFVPEKDFEEAADKSERVEQSSTTPPAKDENSNHQPTEKNDVRFSWSVDENAVFKSASPELAQTVGKNAANIIGKPWRAVAGAFGFDEDGEIASKFEKQDTWSGRTVLWPIENTDMSTPIDLAALPVFGSNREFEGFKGFGIIRKIDAIIDPDAKGLSINSDTFQETQTELPDTSHDWENQEDEALDLGDNSEEDIANYSESTLTDDEQIETREDDETNVVRLIPKEFEPITQPLSDKENSAFEVIGETLRNRNGSTKNNDKGTISSRHLDTSLMENLPVAILVYRTDELLFANQRFLEASGYKNLLALKDAGGIDAILNSSNSDADAEDGNQYLTPKSGGKIAIEPILHTVPWLGEKALLLSFSMADDVILNESLALEISTSSEIQNILDTASDGIVLMEMDGTIISINASAEALFGENYDEAVGKKLDELFADESQSTVLEYLESLSAPGVERLLNDGRDVIGKEKNGGLIPIFLTISKMETSNKLCAVVRDMTSWKKVEEELIQSRRDAVKASEQKSDFLAHVSHEIRTPLNAIIGFSDVMLEERFGPIDNERYRDYLRDINRSGSHVLDLVNDLLDLSKIEAGKLDLTFEAVELNQIVAETVAILQPQANSNRIIIRTSLSRAVPKVVADPRSIRQIILNLVSNAIKFSPANSQVIVSTIYEQNGEVALRVRDTGLGMSQNEIEQAMKPFHQVHNINERAGEGTGLGLPLTKALVEANRALFDLESEPGVGTIAHVQFPTQRVLTE